MKIWIHASNSNANMIKQISNAKRALSRYDKEKVDYVRECQEAITHVISDYYTQDEDYDRPIGSKLSGIKKDYLIGAIEDDLMTEDEFEDIFDLIDVVNFELTAPYT